MEVCHQLLPCAVLGRRDDILLRTLHKIKEFGKITQSSIFLVRFQQMGSHVAVHCDAAIFPTRRSCAFSTLCHNLRLAAAGHLIITLIFTILHLLKCSTENKRTFHFNLPRSFDFNISPEKPRPLHHVLNHNCCPCRHCCTL